MKKAIYILLVSLVMGGCASLTETQIKSVNQFATTSKNFSAYPSKIMTGLADIRYRRGMYVANSLAIDTNQINELNSIFRQKNRDEKFSAEVDISFKIIDKYAQALALLSSDKYTDDLEEQAKNFGESLDELIAKNNAIPGANKLPTGIGTAVNQLIVLGGKQYIRVKQAEGIRQFVPKGDSLITIIVGNLLKYLESAHIKTLIDNEETGLNSSYLSYLRQTKVETRIRTISNLKRDTLYSISTSFNKSSIEDDKSYLELLKNLENVKSLRTQTIKATNDLLQAHHKLLQEIQTKKTLKESIKEIQVLFEEVKELKQTIGKIETQN